MCVEVDGVCEYACGYIAVPMCEQLGEGVKNPERLSVDMSVSAPGLCRSVTIYECVRTRAHVGEHTSVPWLCGRVAAGWHSGVSLCHSEHTAHSLALSRAGAGCGAVTAPWAGGGAQPRLPVLPMSASVTTPQRSLP